MKVRHAFVVLRLQIFCCVIKLQYREIYFSCIREDRIYKISIFIEFAEECNKVKTTLRFPQNSNPRYEGPIGLPSTDGMEGKEKGHIDLIRGFESEMKVIDCLEKISVERNLGLKIFHNVPLQSDILLALCDVFQTLKTPDLISLMKTNSELEIDAVAINACCVCLFEVKSNFAEWGKARMQLNKAEKEFKNFLHIIGIEDVPIKRVIAIPKKEIDNFVIDKARKQLNSEQFKENFGEIRLMIFDDVRNVKEVLETIFPGENNQVGTEIVSLSEIEMTNLMASLAFVQCSRYYPFDKEKVFWRENQLREGAQEGAKGETVASKLNSHEPLVRWQHPKVEGYEYKTKSEARFLWIDCLKEEHLAVLPLKAKKSRKIKNFPETCEFLEHDQFLKKIGGISTSGKSQTILIILPYDNMVEEYSAKIQQIVQTEDLSSITIVTPKEHWQKYTNSCVFVHWSSVQDIAVEKSLMNSRLASTVFKDESKISNLFVWLDPAQVDIMKHTNPCQILRGPASTGKTILIQLKVLQILRNDKNAKILILLPFDRLVEKYKAFFKNAGMESNYENLLIATAEDDELDQFIQTNSPHIFIDEFSAVIARKFLFSEQLKAYLKNVPKSNYMWITIDIKQSLDAFEGNYFTGEIKEISMKDANETFLLIVHRCVKSVFNQYSHICGANVQIGHQHSGSNARAFPVTPEEDNFLKRIKQEVEDRACEGWRKEDICIVISCLPGSSSTFFLLAYLKLQSMNLGIDILFQSETLSQEWPVVIVCGKSFLFLQVCKL